MMYVRFAVDATVNWSHSFIDFAVVLVCLSVSVRLCVWIMLMMVFCESDSFDSCSVMLLD
jgi:hypothetical protein